MTMNVAAPSNTEPARVPETTWMRRALPWIMLALWFLWLLAMVAMSYPYWGKSKRDLIEKSEPPVKRVEINNALGK